MIDELLKSKNKIIDPKTSKKTFWSKRKCTRQFSLLHGSFEFTGWRAVF